MTLTHASRTFTEMPPSTASAQNSPNRIHASRTRSSRRGPEAVRAEQRERDRDADRAGEDAVELFDRGVMGRDVDELGRAAVRPVGAAEAGVREAHDRAAHDDRREQHHVDERQAAQRGGRQVGPAHRGKCRNARRRHPHRRASASAAARLRRALRLESTTAHAHCPAVRRVRALPRERRGVRHSAGPDRPTVRAGRGRRRAAATISALRVGHGRRPSSCWCTAARRTRTPGTPSRSRSTARSSRSTSRVTGIPRTATTTRTGRPRTRSRSSRPCARSRPTRSVVVGMSLGGLTVLALTDRAPDLVRQLVLVDVTPGVNREKSSAIAQFIDGPEYFESFDEILERTVAVQPDAQRVVAAARHPAQRDRSRRRPLALALRPSAARLRRRRRRAGHARARRPVGRGRARQGAVRRWCAAARRRSSTTTTSPRCCGATPARGSSVVEGAGHSVQGDKPLELARDSRGLALRSTACSNRCPTRSSRPATACTRWPSTCSRPRATASTAHIGLRPDAAADSARRCSATASACASTASSSCTSDRARARACGSRRSAPPRSSSACRSARRRCVHAGHAVATPTRRSPSTPTPRTRSRRGSRSADALLDDLRETYAAHDRRPTATIWPEHFDLACELGDADAGTRANYGASPGDGAIARAVPLRRAVGRRAGAPGMLGAYPFGAALTYTSCARAGDAKGAGTRLLPRRRRAAARPALIGRPLTRPR